VIDGPVPGHLPSMTALLWAALLGLGLFLLGSAQPFGQPRPELGERFRRLDPEQRWRLDRQTADRRAGSDPYRRQPVGQLFAPVADEAGRVLSGLLRRVGLAGGQDLEEALRVVWPERTVVQFYGLRVQMLLVTLLPLAIGDLLHVEAGPGAFWAVVLGILGFAAPSLMLQERVRAHHARVTAELSALLTLMTACLRAGHSVEEALAEAGNRSRGPVGRRLRRMRGELMRGASFAEALDGVAYDLGVPEVKRLVQYLRASIALGTPLEDALRAQADGLREARRLALVRRGMRTSVVMLAPVGLMLVGAFVVLLMPAVLQVGALTGP